MRDLGLYLHLPFCHARCGYCDFATFTGQEDKIEEYLGALEKEMAFYSHESIQTLFIGGGTPTVLNPDQISRLLESLKSHFGFSKLSEATVEANPESATPDVLKAYQHGGINRISFGLQSTQNTFLSKLDRLHSYEDFLRAHEAARGLGFKNINLDLIYGLPGQSMENWSQSLKDVLKLEPEHLSLYALKIEEGTKFQKDGVVLDDDLQADQYLLASPMLREAGYDHYEISNFCKPGFASRHNLKYWRNEPTLGLGVSAASFLEGIRRVNTRSLQIYLSDLKEGREITQESTELTTEKQVKENVMLGLRLKEGIDWGTVKSLNMPVFKSFLNQGWAAVEKGRYFLNPQGWLLSNQLFQFLV